MLFALKVTNIIKMITQKLCIEGITPSTEVQLLLCDYPRLFILTDNVLFIGYSDVLHVEPT